MHEVIVSIVNNDCVASGPSLNWAAGFLRLRAHENAINAKLMTPKISICVYFYLDPYGYGSSSVQVTGAVISG